MAGSKMAQITGLTAEEATTAEEQQVTVLCQYTNTQWLQPLSCFLLPFTLKHTQTHIAEQQVTQVIIIRIAVPVSLVVVTETPVSFQLNPSAQPSILTVFPSFLVCLLFPSGKGGTGGRRHRRG